MKSLALKMIRFYQKTLFFHGYIARALFMTDKVCRFTPTCSEYTYQAIERYGVRKGTLIGLRRIIRCHPWSRGGYEPLK
jgi:hypothetical protein